MMRLVTNSVAPTQVTDNGDHYLVENVPFVKPMELSGGYVPEDSIRETATDWQGVPATLNHPRDNSGQPVPADRKPSTHLGRITESWFDGEFVRANIRLDKAELESADAVAVKNALESGDAIHVSSQYRPEPLPPGEYDGRQRENVEAIKNPDSVAILPRKRGKCDIQDGCGINPEMAANSAVSIPMRANAIHYDEGDLVEWSFGSGTGHGRVTETFTEPGTVSRTIDGTDVSREVTEDEGAYLVAVWRDGDGEFRGRALKSGSELSAWQDPPEAVANTDDGEIPEGMADMNANQTVEFALTDVTPDDVDSYTDSEWDGDAATAAMPNPSESNENADVLDAAHLIHPTGEDARDDKSNWKLPFREGPDAPVNTRALVAAKAAIEGARGGVDAPQEDLEGAAERIEDFLVAAPSDLFGSMEEGGSMSENTLREFGRRMLSALQFGNATSSDMEQAANGGAESPADDTPSVNRDELITDITENSKLTEAALAERCNDGLKAIHDDVMADSDSMTNNNDTNNDGSEDAGSEDAITFNSEEEFEEYVDEIVANRVQQREQETKKHDLASSIVANSADYEDTDSVLEDYPTEAALEAKRDSLTQSGGVMPQGGQTANFDGASDDDIDVSSGVLTE